MNYYKLLPEMTRLNDKVKELEKSLSAEFGVTLTLEVRENKIEMAIDRIARLVGTVLVIPLSEMFASGRQKRVVSDSRSIAAYLCYKHIPKIQKQFIADYFSKDHTTICAGIKSIEILFTCKDEDIVRKVNACERELLKLMHEKPPTIH